MIRIQDSELRKLLNFLVQQEEFVFLDTSRPDRENVESLLFLKPVERLLCRPGDNLAEYMAALQCRLDQGLYLAGWVGYEFGAMLEGNICTGNGCSTGERLVLADLGVYVKPCRFDHITAEHDFPLVSDGEWNEDATSAYTIENIRPNMAKEEFLQVLDQVRQYIIAGDTYQVNFTMKLLFDFAGSTEMLYSMLRKNQSVAYSAYIRNGEERILSFSPELFFRKKGNEITVRPMKGTAVKGRTSGEEQHNSAMLHLDGKNRSENVMIVDLLRNDLARLMHGHGESRVFVESLFDVESYESLLQMTSTVKARSVSPAMSKLQLTELFRALFPCGSITGAPKIRTMQIIDALEKERRGVYTGAIGYFGPDGSAVFNVPIRTILLRGNAGEMGIGAGITHDSIAEEEWHESLLKGRFLTHCQPDFELLETLLWQPGTGYWLHKEHLQRLADAAQFFKFSCNMQEVRTRLDEEALSFQDECYRVRLVLAKDGRIALTAVPCAAPALMKLPERPQQAEVSEQPLVAFTSSMIDVEGPWLFHKTTMRSRYEAEFAMAQQNGLYDILFYNGAGEVTEGCITNLIIYRGGRYLTPPVAAGLLPGVMRGHLLASGDVPVVEDILTKDDVLAAEALFLCNSVRGLVRVKMKTNAS